MQNKPTETSLEERLLGISFFGEMFGEAVMGKIGGKSRKNL